MHRTNCCYPPPGTAGMEGDTCPTILKTAPARKVAAPRSLNAAAKLKTQLPPAATHQTLIVVNAHKKNLFSKVLKTSYLHRLPGHLLLLSTRRSMWLILRGHMCQAEKHHSYNSRVSPPICMTLLDAERRYIVTTIRHVWCLKCLKLLKNCWEFSHQISVGSCRW